MQNKIDRIRNLQWVSYFVCLFMCLSFLKDWGLFDWKSTPIEPSNQVRQLETLHQLTQSCLQFSSKYCIKAWIKQQKLLISVEDFQNWIIYSRAYTKQDIGAQIHRKIDLIDIISVLKRERWTSSKNQYIFGNIQRTKQGQSLYSIETNGLITVFVDVSTKNKKEITQSKLNLLKERTMSELEIFHVKLQIQRRLIQTQLRNQISQLQKQNKNIIERLKIMENKCNQSNCLGKIEYICIEGSRLAINNIWQTTIKKYKPNQSTYKFQSKYEMIKYQSHFNIQLLNKKDLTYQSFPLFCNIFNQKIYYSLIMHKSLKVQAKGQDHADQSFIHPTTGNPRQVIPNTKIKNKDEYTKKFFQRRLALEMQVRQQILKKMKSKTPVKKNKIEIEKKMKKKCDKQFSMSHLEKEKVEKQAKYKGLSAEKYQDNYHKFNFNEKMEKNRKEDSTTKYTKQALKYDKDYKLDLGQLMNKNKAQSKFCKLLTVSNRPQIQFHDRPYLNYKGRPQITSHLYEKKRKQEQYEEKSEYIGQSERNIDYFGNKKHQYINPQQQNYEKQSFISIQFNNSKLNQSQRQNGKIKINNKQEKNVLTTPIIYKLGYSGLTNQKSQQQKARSNGFKCEIDESLRARLADMIMQQRQKFRTCKKQLNITPISPDTPISNRLAKNTGIIYNYRQNNQKRYNQMLSQSFYSNSLQSSSIASCHLSRQLHRKHRSPYKEDQQYDFECQQRKSRRLQQYLYNDQISVPMMSRKLCDNRVNGFIFSNKFRNYSEDKAELSEHEEGNSQLNQLKNPGQSQIQLQNLINNEKETNIIEKKMYITPANENQPKKQTIVQQNQHNISQISSEHSQIICAICQTNIPYKLWPYATFYNKNSQQPQYYNFYQIFHEVPIQNEEHNPSQIPILLHCGHPYHKLCIEQWFKYKAVCPLCKTEHEGGQENQQQYYQNEMSHELTFISDSGDDQNEDFVYFHQNRHNHYINNIQQQHEVIQLQEIDVNNLINSRLSNSSNHALHNNFMVTFNNFIGQSSNYRGIGYNRAINRQLTNLQIQSSIELSSSGWDGEIDRPLRRNIGSINRNILHRQQQIDRQSQSQSQVDRSLIKLAQSECESNSNDDDQKLQIQSFIGDGQSLQSCALYSEQDN